MSQPRRPVIRPLAGNFSYSGGAVGNAFAAVLGPAGYERERYTVWGPERYDRYRGDFVHVAAKVNIELDGPFHRGDPVKDALRDSRLRTLGWKIIRIKH